MSYGLSPRIYGRQYADPDTQPIKLEGFEVNSSGLSMLNVIKDSLGAKNPLIVGGALTAWLLGKEARDRDVHLSFYDITKGESSDLSIPFEELPEVVSSDLEKTGQFSQYGDIRTVVHESQIGAETIEKIYANIPLLFKDAHGEHAVDLCLTEKKFTLEKKAMYGDSTVTSIAANADGLTMCHPLLPSSIKEGNCLIRVTGSDDTQNSLRRLSERVRDTNHHLYGFNISFLTAEPN